MERAERGNSIDKPVFGRQTPSRIRQPFTSSSSDAGGRKDYGSVKPTSKSDGSGSLSAKYRVEDGDSGMISVDQLEVSKILAQMENPEAETRWYFKYFLGKVHNNYLGTDHNKETFVVSTCFEMPDKPGPEPILRCLLFRKTGCLRLAHRCKERPMPLKMILQSFSVSAVKHPRAVLCPTFQKELLVLENQEGSMNFKFGVLYCKADQTGDDDFFSNENGSPEFDRFVELLGDKVELMGFPHFRGGLDVRTGTTGTHSAHTTFQGHEIMFHVSTLLPFSPKNKQQLERKRHIGNDIIVIAFFDGDDLPDFQPANIKSHFNHIFAVVCYSKKESAYKLQMFSEKNVPLFSPALPNPAVFGTDKFDVFRNFLLVKLINGEKACYQSVTFRDKRQRTLSTLLGGFEEQYGESHSKLTVRKDTPAKNTKKHKAYTTDFMSFGQDLKAHEALKGDAPITEATVTNDAWDAEHFMSFPSTIDFAEQIRDDLLVHCDEGTFRLDGQSLKLVIEKSIVVKQIIVCEEHGLLLVLGSKYVHCFSLQRVFAPEPIGRYEMKTQRLEASKGCSVMAVCRGSNIVLRLAVAVGKRLQMFVWRTTMTSRKESLTETVFDGPDGFLALESINILDTPTGLLLVDHHLIQSYQHNKVVVSYRNVYDVVDEHTHDIERLFENPAESMVTSPIVDHYEDDKVELLLTYNNITCFKDISTCYGMTRKETLFHWTCMPTSIVSKFPYIVGFGSDNIEIRLYINGTIVKNMDMQNVRLLSSKRDIFIVTSQIPGKDGMVSDQTLAKGQMTSHIYTLTCNT